MDPNSNRIIGFVFSDPIFSSQFDRPKRVYSLVVDYPFYLDNLNQVLSVGIWGSGLYLTTQLPYSWTNRMFELENPMQNSKPCVEHK